MAEINRALKSRMRDIQAVLQEEGIPLIVGKTEKPGKQHGKH